jgi:oligopeptidase B
MPFAPQSSVTPPVAARNPHTLDGRGGTRIDDYYWLGDKEDPEVLAYLEAENAYADAVLAPTADLQADLFAGIKARVVETDVDAPVRHGGYWYWTRSLEGKQYGMFCRRHDPERKLDAVAVLADAREETAVIAADPEAADASVFLDENVLAGDSEYFALGVWDLSPDQSVLAYAVDLDGSEQYALRFLDLTTGENRPDEIDDVTYGSAWSADGSTFFYVRADESLRPFQVWRHVLGQDNATDTMVYEDLDERFFVSVGATRSERFVVVQSQSKMTSECAWLDATQPASAPAVVLPRTDEVEYDIEHAVWPGEGDVWLIRTNRPAADGTVPTDFELLRMPVGGGADDLVEVLPHRPGTKINDVDAFAGHVVITERTEGLEQIRILTPSTGASELIPQPDAVFSLAGAANPEWDSSSYRFGYTSLVTPMSVIEIDVPTGRRQVIRVQPVRGYDASRFVTHRIWATAPDGTRVPVSLVARADVATDGTAACLLYGYGSYELSMDPGFSSLRLSLLERGVVFAIAHIRGGGEMGRHWHEQGRLAHKTNTFTDFISCAEHLVATGWAAPDRLAIRGGSAGGLLMGAATNLRPDLWKAVVAEVPFVDVVTTMSDPSLPLTVTEWEEWGNPLESDADFDNMLSYSPYDNLRPATASGEAITYPAMYVSGGLNDPRVGYWEPAKWVAKMRATVANRYPLVLRTELGAGHQGLSGRYDVWKDEARVYAFLLVALGVEG